MRISKRRNWQAVRLEYSPTPSGWSECGAWHVAHISDPDVVIQGNGMKALVDKLMCSKPAHWVFLNLDIDGRLLMGYLLHNGWRSVDDESPAANEFAPLISDDGRIIRIRLRTKLGLQDVDDMKRIVPMSMESLKQMVMDGQTDWRISDEVSVGARMLKHLNTEDLTRFTLSGNAYNDFLETLGTHRYQQLFPKLNARQNRDASEAFTGGFVYLNPEYRGLHTGPGVSVDANSLYPFVALANRLPVGRPKRFEGEPEDDGLLTMMTVTIDWSLKPDGLPMMPMRWRKYEDDPGESAQPVTMTITDIDMEILRENYDITVTQWHGGWKFYGRRGVFDTYMGKWGAVKRGSTGARRLMAKLMINALLGKFGSRTRRASRIPRLGADGHVTYELQPERTSKGIYTPLAAWVTAYARRELCNAMKANRSRLIYADTDSMHLTGDAMPEGIRIDPTAFGAWKVEKHFSDAVHLREKSYMWTDASTGETECKVSGMPANISSIMTYETFHPGWCNWGDSGTVIPGLERWLPYVVDDHVRMVEGRYRIGS